MKRTPTTTERGLGWEHQKRRKAAVAAFVPGTPCAYCGEPMWNVRQLDLDHVLPRAAGGARGPVRLVHRACNRAEGFNAAVRARGGSPETKTNSEEW